MAVIKIPYFHKGEARGPWAAKLQNCAVYAVESEAINYDTGSSVQIFSIPEDFILMGIGLEVATAFDGSQPTIVVKDTAENLAIFEDRAIKRTGFLEYAKFKRYTRSARSGPGRGSRDIQVDVDAGGSAAGIARVWLKFRPSRQPLRADNA